MDKVMEKYGEGHHGFMDGLMEGTSARYRGHDEVNEARGSVSARGSVILGLQPVDEGTAESGGYPSHETVRMTKGEWLAYKVKRFMQSQICETLVGLVILANFAILAYEADERIASVDGTIPAWIDAVNKAFLVFYSVEVCLRLGTERMSFFQVSWNCLDLFIVVIGIIGEIFSAVVAGSGGSDAFASVNLLRTFRTIRLVRAVRLMTSFPEMWAIINSLASCFKTLLWSAILILVMLTIWSIIAVEFIQPYVVEMAEKGLYDGVDCPYCPKAFDSVMLANLTLFQIMTGDGWSVLARPLIEHYPALALFFIAIIFIMVFGMLNLITAVLVDTAAREREADHANLASQKAIEQKKAVKKLVTMCQDIDEDSSGTISQKELAESFNTSEEFAATMVAMDVCEEDLECIFEILDADGSGDVSYIEFAENLFKMKTQESRTTMMLTKHHVEQTAKEVASLKKLLLPSLNVIEDTVLAHNVEGMNQIQQLGETFAENLTSLRAHLAAATGGPGCSPKSSINGGMPLGTPIGSVGSKAMLQQQHGMVSDRSTVADTNVDAHEDLRSFKSQSQNAQVQSPKEMPMIVAMPGNAPVPRTPQGHPKMMLPGDNIHLAIEGEEEIYAKVFKELTKVTIVLSTVEQMLSAGRSQITHQGGSALNSENHALK